jgi:hypothetical protein
MMIAARETQALRRRGYRVAGRPTPIGQLVEDAGLRLRPMNRMQPRYGHHVGDCPRCGHTDGLWIAPGWRSFSTSCGCVRGDAGPLALYGLLLRGAA